MNKTPLSVPARLRETAWAKLSPWQRRKVATHLVVSLLYPSLRPSKSKRRNRRKAFRVLAARPYQQALSEALQPGANADQTTDGYAVLKQISKWVPTIFDAGSYEYFNRNRANRRWDEWWAHVYLFVLSMIRLRAAATGTESALAGKATQARAILLITATNPGNKGYKAERAKLEQVIAKRRPFWPILCGLLYTYLSAEKHSSPQNDDKLKTEGAARTKVGTISSMHDLLPDDSPTASELIECLMRSPEKVARAAKYFENELTQTPTKAQSKRAEKPLLEADAALEIPFRFRTPTVGASVAMPPLTRAEIEELTSNYEFRRYRGGKEAREKRRGPQKDRPKEK